MKTEVNGTTTIRKRFLKKTMIWTIGLFIILLSWSQASEVPILTVTEIEDVPNLYFDNMGLTRVYHRQWKILYNYDLIDLDAIEDTIINCFKTTVRTFHETSHQVYDGPLRALLNRFFRAMKDKSRLLNSIRIFNETTQESGSLNPIENVANIIFGTLSSKDAEYYNSEIDNLYANNKTLAIYKDKGTTIARGLFKDLTNYKDKIQTTTELFNQIIENNIQELHKLSMLLTLSEIVTEYTQLVVKLESLITNGIQGKLNPAMFDQVSLLTILKVMQSKLGPEQMFYPAEKDKVSHYQQIIKINIFGLQRTKLCFELLIPILESEIYSLYQLVPVPLIEDKLMYFVSITERFILLDNSTKHYNPIKMSHINNCVIIDKNRLCELDTSMLATTYQDPCISRAIHQLPEENNCPKTVAKIFNPIWVELYSKQTWISITRKPESLNITCQNLRNETKIIEGINIISIASDCVGNMHSTTLLPTKLKSDITMHTVPLGMTNVTVQELDDTSLAYAKIPEFYESIISPEHFSSHSKSLSEITEEASEILMHVEATTQSDNDWSTLDISEVVIGILSLFYYILFKLCKISKCCKCCKCCCKCCTCCCKRSSNDRNTDAEQTVRFSKTCKNQPTSTLDEIDEKP
ncbi:uncharacterized protein LOC128890076 [Hylaeus anthracinus]|uniref:uncharacterized protein LOC128890076 n=1 Tax=Hylaeus anthracinus TaxID=313031 RepID=UPI0023B8EE62|nr:uncharacterized protein LOC128890076 [Hylaeus anthracinus]